MYSDLQIFKSSFTPSMSTSSIHPIDFVLTSNSYVLFLTYWIESQFCCRHFLFKNYFLNCSSDDKIFEIFDAQAIIRQICFNHPILHRRLRSMDYNQRNRFLNHCIKKLSLLEKQFPGCSKRILIANIIPPTVEAYWKQAVFKIK